MTGQEAAAAAPSGADAEHLTALLHAATALDPDRASALAEAYLERAGALEEAKQRARVLMGWATAEEDAAARAAAGAPHDVLLSAFHAGWHTGWNGSPVVAWTALALAGRHVLPADVYTGLTAPWAAVVGRVHPDDVRSDVDCMWPAGRVS